jgi:hypothetical protein
MAERRMGDRCKVEEARRAANRRDANPAPKAKRSIGPKLLAAANPRKYKPGTEDINASHFGASVGVAGSSPQFEAWQSA